MEYYDFILHLRSAPQQTFCVSVPWSPAGEFEEPLPTKALPWEWSRESSAYALRDFQFRTSVGRNRGEPEEIGSRLFGAIFPEAIRVLFERSLETTRTQGKGLRVTILLNPRDSAVRFLQGLPWELLFHKDIPSQFLALSRYTPVVRSLFVPQTPRCSHLSTRLRILAARSLPPGTTALDLQSELSEMESARERGAVEVFPWRARLNDLRETLDRHGPFDILHFMGHADFQSDLQEGVLLFETDNGERELVSASTLAKTLSDVPGLGLVVLNACKTAQSTSTTAGNPFGGVAAALVQAGFPSVLAMQEVIQDKSAIALSRALYRTLANRQPVEAAVTEARHAVHILDRSNFEWAIPCLYRRTSTIFQGGTGTNAPGPDALQAGLDAFRSGEYLLARQLFAEVPKRDPGSTQAKLFETLACMVIGAPLSMNAALKADAALQKFLTEADCNVADLARLALGILRHDVIEPRYLRPQGKSTALLFAELERRRRTTDIEREVAQALHASRDARIRFKLQS